MRACRIALGLGLAIGSLAAAATGCSSKSRTAGEPPLTPVRDGASRDGANRDGGPPGDGPAPGDGAAAGLVRPPPSTTGDVQVRVEWKAVPVAARASMGLTPCQTPRAPAVAPTTMWGIPDAIVIVDGAPAPAAASDRTVRVVLADCALTPRVGAGSTLIVASGVSQPAKVDIAKRGALASVTALDARAAATAIQLPIAGHQVELALETGGVYEVRAGEESAWIVGAVGAITDATGQVLVKDVAPGSHAVTAWLPPRGGQPARVAHGRVDVVAGDLAELTVELE